MTRSSELPRYSKDTFRWNIDLLACLCVGRGLESSAWLNCFINIACQLIWKYLPFQSGCPNNEHKPQRPDSKSRMPERHKARTLNKKSALKFKPPVCWPVVWQPRLGGLPAWGCSDYLLRLPTQATCSGYLPRLICLSAFPMHSLADSTAGEPKIFFNLWSTWFRLEFRLSASSRDSRLAFECWRSQEPSRLFEISSSSKSKKLFKLEREREREGLWWRTARWIGKIRISSTIRITRIRTIQKSSCRVHDFWFEL